VGREGLILNFVFLNSRGNTGFIFAEKMLKLKLFLPISDGETLL
jgi:hypothetical protein